METPQRELQRFRLNLLGELELRSGNGALIEISAKKSKALIVYLVLSHDGARTRDRIARLLWSDTELTFAKTNLRQCLSALRKQIDNQRNGLIATHGNQVILDLSKVDLDIDVLSSIEIETNPATANAKIKGLACTALLADFPSIDPEFDGWLEQNRVRYFSRYRRAIESFLETDGSDKNALKDLADELLSVEQENESAHLWLVKHHIAEGNRLAALRQYEACRFALAPMDVTPAPEITRLYNSLRQKKPTSLPLPLEKQLPEQAVQLKSKVTTTISGNSGTNHRNRLLLPGLVVALILIYALRYFPIAEPYWSTTSTSGTAQNSILQTVSNKPEKSLAAQYSIAVIPFRNLSENQTYLSDGISEDLVTEISRVSGLTVIASESSFQFRDREDNLEQLKQQLPVDYLLTGSVRRSIDQLRINVHLIRTRDNVYVWSDKFDREMKDLLRVQDEITRHIVASLSVELTESEWQRLSQHRKVSPEAYDLLLRGLHPFSQFTEEGVSSARDYFLQSIEADPGYARPYANMALSFGREVVFQLAVPDQESISAGLEYADKAEDLDSSLPQTQFARAVLHLANRDHINAVVAAKKSISIDPNYADGFAVLAQTLAYKGKLDEALEAVFQAKFLNPVVPFTYHWVEGHILYQLKRYEEARAALESVYQSNPSFYIGLVSLAATYGQLGDIESAQWINEEILVHRTEFSATAESKDSPYLLMQHRKHLLEGLRKAGLPG